MKYTILNRTFNTFDEVVTWAWNEHKIDFDPIQEDKDYEEIACLELEELLRRSA